MVCFFKQDKLKGIKAQVCTAAAPNAFVSKGSAVGYESQCMCMCGVGPFLCLNLIAGCISEGNIGKKKNTVTLLLHGKKLMGLNFLSIHTVHTTL